MSKAKGKRFEVGVRWDKHLDQRLVYTTTVIVNADDCETAKAMAASVATQPDIDDYRVKSEKVNAPTVTATSCKEVIEDDGTKS